MRGRKREMVNFEITRGVGRNLLIFYLGGGCS